MATVTLTFSSEINTSLQRKSDAALTGQDIVYFVNSSGQVVRLGPCIAINGSTISVNADASNPRPVNGNFVFFGKDTESGTSGVIGYYSEVEFKNESTVASELFTVSTEFFPSSK